MPASQRASQRAGPRPTAPTCCVSGSLLRIRCAENPSTTRFVRQAPGSQVQCCDPWCGARQRLGTAHAPGAAVCPSAPARYGLRTHSGKDLC